MNADRVMLLIDADNVSVDVMEQALARLLEEHGAVHVRRAYCTAESAQKNQAAFKRLSIRPMVNLAAGKNSTDIALAVDALDLVIAERPQVVVIASSDSDFAPLVSRLREKGCRVRGVGQQGKTGSETEQIYDDFVEFAARASRARKTATRKSPSARTAATRSSVARTAAPAVAPPAPAESEPPPPPARKSARRGTAAKRATDAAPASKGRSERARTAATPPAAAPTDPAPPETAPRKRSRRPAATSAAVPAPDASGRDRETIAASARPASAATPATAGPQPDRGSATGRPPRRTGERGSRSSSASANAAALPSTAAAAAAPVAPPREVTRLLDVLPALARGEMVELQKAAEALRRSGQLSRRSTAQKLFAKYPDWFRLAPADDPRQVGLVRPMR